jgi:hypothetical protein
MLDHLSSCDDLFLQAMMKDQYANYVVQKVLETCDDQQRELLLSRIKVHLHALKKYTYGKHIVARVEKLVAAGGKLIFSMSLQIYCECISHCSSCWQSAGVLKYQCNFSS